MNTKFGTIPAARSTSSWSRLTTWLLQRLVSFLIGRRYTNGSWPMSYKVVPLREQGAGIDSMQPFQVLPAVSIWSGRLGTSNEQAGSVGLQSVVIPHVSPLIM